MTLLVVVVFLAPLLYMKILAKKVHYLAFIYGVFAPIISTLLLLLWPLPHVIHIVLIGPMLEELAKGLVASTPDRGVASGAGFASAENSIYAVLYPSAVWSHAMRVLFTSTMHCVATRQIGKGIEAGHPIRGYMKAVAIHSGWNLLTLFM
tara:strand:+ start:310 stop:759 length:450 start_codon:yes stop_codon:yes gene_type:complete